MHMHMSMPSTSTMKTERVTLLTTPQFKTFLSVEAKREGISVAELVRARCERRPTEDELALVALTVELRKVVGEARRALREGLHEAGSVLGALRDGKDGGKTRADAAPSRRSRKAAGSAA